MSRFKIPTLLLLTAAVATACQTTTTPPATPTPLGLMELTISGLGSQDVHAELRPVRAGLNAQAVTALPGGVQVRALSTSAFDVGTRGAGGQRYLSATFEVRNASYETAAAYPDARQNLTFFAVSAASTLQGTAITRLTRFDGTAADPGVAPNILPTHGMEYSPLKTAAVVTAQAADFQAFTEAEADPQNWTQGAQVTASGVTSVFPYGFVVRRASGVGRALPGNPAAGQFDGRVTFAYRLPLQATAAADPFEVRILLQATEDSVARVTESLEEQVTPGTRTVTQRAADLQATLPAGTTVQVATFAGSTYAGPNTVAVCRVRTAGTAAAPTTYLGSSC
ncbi:hypothetical protein [Deinococcus radiotolerans]|uniref:DUF4352 domain-containing protein n=1 Tax=Deinococcus radiotolerans TaxID=1309407 RepID=A0ABQ2FD16_9DEIO|nr:hypothetical protein [Deinococcus radiotolerans]GGK85769.1 hypothetical protein GCM10010844_00360 [Deinococcus radiotolerans]